MMSSVSEVVQTVKPPPPKTTQSNKSINNNSKRKFKHDRGGRKRSKSFSGIGIIINHKPVLPTKFLLGGNINDPLNLNSLQDEEINRAMNAVTPKSSPIPTPPRRKGQVDVIIPANINDPLSLIDCADDAEYEQQLASPIKKGRKKRLKKKRTISTTSEPQEEDPNANSNSAKTPENSSDSAKIPEIPKVEITTDSMVSQQKKDLTIELLSPKKDKKRKSEEFGHIAKKFKYSMDKIVSPVVPQPGAWLKRMNSRGDKPRHNKPVNEELPLFKEKNKQFQYGNYNRYYGYRNQNSEDHRLKVFHYHKNLFEGKDILDIGCNIGHVTLSVARDLQAKAITGIDIDNKLIGIARKNIKHYVAKNMQQHHHQQQPSQAKDPNNAKQTDNSSEFFPISMPILYGAIDIPGFGDHKGDAFPNNVTFKHCNYVLDDDALIALEQPQFDLILCLSITKWIHLNFGDGGIKQAFRRMYAQLRPGGKLILEPQSWSSYKSKKKLTPVIFKNYNSIEFFPEKFTEYLLSPAVGFAKCEILGFPSHHSKGFRRPIQVYTKSTMFPSERVEATPRGITPNASSVYADYLLKTEKCESRLHPVPVEGIDHIYTNIFNRYCGCSEDNIKINEELRNCLDKPEEKTEEITSQSPSVESSNNTPNTPLMEGSESEKFQDNT